MTVDQAVFAYLTGKPEVSALIGSRLFPGYIPPKEASEMIARPGKVPCMTYDVAASGDEMTNSGPTGLFTSTLQLSVVDGDYATVRTVAKAVRLALLDPVQVWGTLRVYRVDVDPAIPVDYNDDLRLNMGTVSVHVQHAKET